MKPVANVQPRIPASYRIAIVGEAPGEDEETTGIPFMGQSGRLLNSLLMHTGINRDACFVGNVCQHRPPGNHISAFSWDGQEIQQGLYALSNDLSVFKPNIVVLLGNTPLKAFGADKTVSVLRGSLFRSTIPELPYKCMATYHPAFALRERSWIPIIGFDLKRALSEGQSPELVIPQRQINSNPDLSYVLDQLAYIKENRIPIALDIEGYVDAMSCISIATSPITAFIIPFSGPHGGQYWKTASDEALVWQALASVLTDPQVPKRLQNAMYDNFVLAHSYGILVRGMADDTMLKHWELYCELEKSLAFQASIYTKEPYWKHDRKANDWETFYRYGCTDSAVTYEISDVLEKRLRGGSYTHYKFNVRMLEPLLYMQMRGIKYDTASAKSLRAKTLHDAYELQYKIDEVYGTQAPTLAGVAEKLCFKKRLGAVRSIDDIVPNAKDSCVHDAIRVTELVRKSALTRAETGELHTLLEIHLNVNSVNARDEDGVGGDVPMFLYSKLKLEVQYKKVGGRSTEKETTDVLALLNLYKKTENETLYDILVCRAKQKFAQTLNSKIDNDGRIRGSYNLVGSETGRVTCYKSTTGGGYNLQTVTKKQRHLFVADDDHYFFQCDLAGADGWTVAAHCRAHGDSTMLDDYNAGLKPAKIVALMYLEYPVELLNREQLKPLCADIKDGEATTLCPLTWLYFACKRVQHGSSYGMGERTMSDQILKDTYKLSGELLVISPATCKRIQTLFFKRYPGIQRWHNWVHNKIINEKAITSASGHKRIFLGDPKDHETFKSALSDEPQNNTTYLTNLAALNIWSSQTNRTSDGHLRVEPLHQVHDAVCGQFRISELAYARREIRRCFANPIAVAGTVLTIPFEGRYGRSWGELTHEL